MTVLSPDADNWSSEIRTVVQNGARVRDFDLLFSEYTAAAQGETRCVVVEGASGSGAAELLSAFAERVGNAGASVYRYSCRALDADLDYEVIRRLTGLPAPDSRAPQRLSPAYSRVFSDRLGHNPVVVLVEQAHWCDEPSLRWLELLLRRCRGLPLLLVLSQRPALLPQWHRLLDGASPPVERHVLVLDGVEDNDVYDWLTRSWRRAPDVQFALECRRITLGQPGLLYALAQILGETGCEPDAAGVALVTRHGQRLLAEHIAAVLQDHPDHVRRVAEALAVLGQPDHEMLALLAPVPAALISSALELLRGEGLLEGPGRMPGPVREAVLDGMGEAARDAKYDRAARLLNDTGAAADRVGELLLRLPALDEPWMKDILRQAGDQAERAGDVAGAVRHRTRLIEPPDRDVEDVIAYARALAHLEPMRAHRLIEDALRTEKDVRVRAALAVQLGKSAIVLDTVPEAVGVLTAVRDELPPAGSAPGDEPARERRVQLESALLILACYEAPAVPGGVRRTRGAQGRRPWEDGEAAPFDTASAPFARVGGFSPPGRPARPGPGTSVVNDLAEALEGAQNCGWILPDAGPAGPEQLSWWIAVAPALLKCERAKAVSRGPAGSSGHRPQTSPWLRLATQLAPLTAVRPVAAPRTGRGGVLTPSERQVARLAATGASNRQIAASQFISLRTVEMHLTSVYRKLGIAGRPGLTAVWQQPRPGDAGRIGA